MFTGIVEELGTVSQIQKTDTGKQFTITANVIMDDLKVGDSVSVNGVCLSVRTYDKNSFNLDLVKETLKKSNLGDLKNKSLVNLERAITLSTRLGGHIIQGHVETVGVIMDKVPSGEDGAILSVGIDPGFMRYCISKGSIALDGVSLTIASMSENIIKIALIPHTLEMTTLGSKDVGDSLNIETDIIGKYIERLMSFEDDDQMEELLLKGLKNWEFGES